jgi:hypothetical protein
MNQKNTAALLERRYFRLVIVIALAVLPLVITLPQRNPALTGLLVALTLVVFFTAVLVSSQFLLPLLVPTMNERVNTFLALLGWLLGMHRASYLVEDLTSKRTVEAGMGMFPGVIVVDGHSVVVTRRFLHYLRVLGPGTHFTQPLERVPVLGDGSKRGRVREVIDLRKQMRVQPVTAQTKDGLIVSTALITIFYIDRDPDPKLDERHIYRYYEQAVQKAVMSERVGEKSSERYDWTTLPTAHGTDMLLQIISTYTVDELYAPREDDEGLSQPEMRKRIREELTAELREKLRAYGIYLLSASCTKIAPVDARVTRQRVDAWRANRERQIEIEEAYAYAEVDRDRKLARGEAQRDMILRIIDGVQAVPEQYHDSLVPLRLVAALEDLFGNIDGDDKAESGHARPEGDA